MKRLRVVVAEDETLVRQGLASLLAMEPDLEIVAQAANGVELMHIVRTLLPDVALVDIQMPLMNGVEATRAINEEGILTKVVILTTFSEDALIVQALQNGACCYLLKDSGAKQIATAVRSAAMGYMALTSEVGAKIVGGMASSKTDVSIGLTNRENQVLKLLGQGLSNRDIAGSLSITEKTVRDHVSNILSQLGLRDRTQAALWAQEHLLSGQE